METVLLSRQELARRWKVHVRTIDRLRKSGELSWDDFATSPGKALVRIRLTEIERFESGRRHAV